ncbi:MAG: ribosome rescue protein RqcH [Nitrososphaerota archaeon]|nr:ribosome rescue protein RqcH [Nitrososphaerota archaeon]
MEISALELSVLLREMSGALLGCIVDNVYQLEDGSIVLKLRGRESTYELRISAGNCIYFTPHTYPKPKTPTSLAMKFRKFLNGGRLEFLEQMDNERIAVLNFKRDGSLKLIVELIPKGNVVLVDEANKILVALFNIKTKDREIAAGKQYMPPPPRFSLTDCTDVKKMVMSASSKKKLVSWLASELGLGGKYAEEVVALANVDRQVPVDMLDEDGRRKVADAIECMLIAFKEPRPHIARRDSEVKAVPFILKSLEKNGYTFESVNSFNEAVAIEYEAYLAKEYEDKVVNELKQKLKEIQESMEAKKNAIKELETKIERIKSVAEKLFLMLHEVESFRQLIKEGSPKPVDDLKFISVDRSKGIAMISINGIEFELSLDEPVSRQLEKMFDEVKRLKLARERILGEVSGLESEISRITSELESKKPYGFEHLKHKAREKKRWFEKFRWFETSEGLLAVAGKDAYSNIVLLKKHLQPDDLVFHAEITGAPVVILKGGSRASEGSIEEVAQFAASYSRAWREGLSSINVYYVRPDQVSFSAPSGEYLPKGSFMVTGKKNYVKTKLVVAFGLQKGEEAYKLIHGPPSAVAAKSRAVVEVVPGNEDAARLSSKIVDLLCHQAGFRLSDEEKRTLAASVAQMIPYGRGALQI